MTAPVCNHSKHSLGIIPPPPFEKTQDFSKAEGDFSLSFRDGGKKSR